MGTYTTNKELFMPTIGEQGWGTLVNGNFETIDNFLKPITVSGSTYTFTGNHVGNQSGGSISATSITNSGTLTSTGKITANGGIGTTSLTTSSTITSTGKITANGGITGALTGNVTGNVTGNTNGFLFVKGTVGTSGDENYATLASLSNTLTINESNWYAGVTATLAVSNYSISYGNPKKHSVGVYTRRSDLSGTTSPSVSTRTLTVKVTGGNGMYYYFGYKLSTESSYSTLTFNGSGTQTVSLQVGKTYNFKFSGRQDGTGSVTYSLPAGTTYKVKYATP